VNNVKLNIHRYATGLYFLAILFVIPISYLTLEAEKLKNENPGNAYYEDKYYNLLSWTYYVEFFETVFGSIASICIMWILIGMRNSDKENLVIKARREEAQREQ
jgi:ABC-type sulfate transport system permease component